MIVVFQAIVLCLVTGHDPHFPLASGSSCKKACVCVCVSLGCPIQVKSGQPRSGRCLASLDPPPGMAEVCCTVRIWRKSLTHRAHWKKATATRTGQHRLIAMEFDMGMAGMDSPQSLETLHSPRKRVTPPHTATCAMTENTRYLLSCGFPFETA